MMASCQASVIELSPGAFLYLAINILRVRLIPRGAQVDFERDFGAHRVFESLVHEDIVDLATGPRIEEVWTTPNAFPSRKPGRKPEVRVTEVRVTR
jgi:hypothetical protein